MTPGMALFTAAATATSTLIVIKRVVPEEYIDRYAGWLDVGATVGLAVLLGGTLGGATVAILAGLFLSAALYVRKLWRRGTPAGQPHDLFGLPAEEFNEDGEWVYNCSPYTRNA